MLDCHFPSAAGVFISCAYLQFGINVISESVVTYTESDLDLFFYVQLVIEVIPLTTRMPYSPLGFIFILISVLASSFYICYLGHAEVHGNEQTV